MKNYLYVSADKIESYAAQHLPTLSKVKIKNSFKTGISEHSIEVEPQQKNTRYSILEQVIASIEARGLMGDLFDFKPWFRCTLPVSAYVLGEMVFYSSRLDSIGPPVTCVFQCALGHHIGHEMVIEELRRHVGSMPKTVRLNSVRMTIPSGSSASSSFASALGGASSSLERVEGGLISASLRDERLAPTYFNNEADYS